MEGPFPSSSSLLDHYYPMSSINCTTLTSSELMLDDEKSSSLGFMELLINTQDDDVINIGPPSIFDVLQATNNNTPSVVVQPLIHSSAQSHAHHQDLIKSDQVFNAPPTPNTSSISSESNYHDEHTKQEEEEEEEENQKTNKTLKPKKTIQKRQREPRFAFMTKSQVDHLEDGYRWRKYGQKAVKNSPFPRSYYRCTNSSCNVKKRVERSFNDPSIVVTTYEGQHTHTSPQVPRRIIATIGPPPPYYGFSVDDDTTTPSAVLSHNDQLHFNNDSSCGGYNGSMNYSMTQHWRFCSKSSSSALLTDDGLLEDVVPWSLVKKEEQ